MYIKNQEDLYEGEFANKNIDKVVFGSNVNYIPENCFNGCNNLKEIVFKGNIDNIETTAFMGCKNLKTISANNINIIKDFAFHGCDNIIDFNIKEDMANNIIYGINNDILSTYFLLPEIGTPLNNISWRKLNLISKKNKFKEYLKIGDEKELIIGEYSYSYYNFGNEITITHPKTTYHVQILGFNHDDLSDGSGKAGITVGLKEIMTTYYNMNLTNTNIGGWKDSEMRTYLNNDVYNALSSDLQTVIKTVNKVSDNGNRDTTTLNITQDKLFLFSTTEVGLDGAYSVDGQGVKYEYFVDDISRTKKCLNNPTNSFDSWWLRSTWIGNNTVFF